MQQFPDLYKRIVALCERAGVSLIPETYIMQAEEPSTRLIPNFCDRE